MDEDVPASLPEVDSVEIVVLRGVDADRVSEYMSNARAAPFVAVGGREARGIAALWRQLPAGEMMRCHVPRFGFRFFAAGRLVAEASVCWCNNLFGSSGERRLFLAFDGSHAASQRLLAEARRLTGVNAEG